jgi:hypothetical protein
MIHIYRPVSLLLLLMSCLGPSGFRTVIGRGGANFAEQHTELLRNPCDLHLRGFLHLRGCSEPNLQRCDLRCAVRLRLLYWNHRGWIQCHEGARIVFLDLDPVWLSSDADVKMPPFHSFDDSAVPRVVLELDLNASIDLEVLALPLPLIADLLGFLRLLQRFLRFHDQT